MHFLSDLFPLLSDPLSLLSSLLFFQPKLHQGLFFLTLVLVLFALTLSILSVPILRSSLSPWSLSPPLSVSLRGWVPAAELVGLVAGVTARLSGVACDQGGRRTARTIGAERLRLTAGHLSRAISVGAEARLPLVGPAYCEDQRQSVSTLHSALSRSPSFHISASNPHSLFLLSLFVAALSLWVLPSCAFAALWLMVAVWQYVIRLLSSLFITHSFTYLPFVLSWNHILL